MSNRYIEILPSNISSTDDAGYSKGTPLIQFNIGSQDTYLIGSTLRLNGAFSRTGSNSTKSCIDPALGVYSIIDQLLISSNKTNQTIEHIRNYNRFLASYIPATTSENDLNGHMSMSSLSGLSYGSQNNSETLEFSIPLPCGVLLGRNPIPLSDTWGIKGLNLTLNLAPDSNVFFALDDTDVSGVTYFLSDLRITAEVQQPPPDQLATLMRQTANSFEYNSISSYYAVVNNNHATVNISLGLKRVLSVFCNFITASDINSFDANGMETLDIRQDGGTGATLTDVVFTKGGMRFPLDYDIVTVQRDNSNNDSADGQIIRNFLNSVRPFSKLDRTLFSNITSSQLAKKSSSLYGVGVAYDTISNQGVDFSADQFAMVLQSLLNSNNPTAAFIFAHAKNTCLMSPQGIQVLS
jgi:hypothetical protein